MELTEHGFNYSTNIEDALSCDVIFVVVQTPSTNDFKYDHSIIERIKDELIQRGKSSNRKDLIINENDFIKTAIIPSKVITDSYLKVFMVFNDRIEDRLFKFNPDLKPNEDRRGLHSEVVFFGEFNAEDFRKKDSLRLVYFKTFNQIHKITIDNKKFESKFIAGTTKNKRLGFETYLNIDSLTEGKHLLKISRKYINKN